MNSHLRRYLFELPAIRRSLSKKKSTADTENKIYKKGMDVAQSGTTTTGWAAEFATGSEAAVKADREESLDEHQNTAQKKNEIYQKGMAMAQNELRSSWVQEFATGSEAVVKADREEAMGEHHHNELYMRAKEDVQESRLAWTESFATSSEAAIKADRDEIPPERRISMDMFLK